MKRVRAQWTGCTLRHPPLQPWRHQQGRRLGVVATVRAIETLGEMLIEMRHAPDARLLLEVALVKLTKQSTGDDLSGLLARIERLEAGVV